MAEGSPERECGEGSRREFPGRVTRSAGGCRVYVPSGRDDGGDCPGSVLNDDETLVTFVTIGQECPDEQAKFATANDPSRERVVEGTANVEANVVIVPTGLLTADLPLLRPASMTTEDVPIANSASFATPEPIRIVVVVDEFGRDTCVVDEVCQMIEDMPRPWSAYRAFEAATARFPNIPEQRLFE